MCARRNVSSHTIKKFTGRDEELLEGVREAQTSNWSSHSSGGRHSFCRLMAPYDPLKCESICRSNIPVACRRCTKRTNFRTVDQVERGSQLKSELRTLELRYTKGDVAKPDYLKTRRDLMESLASTGELITNAAELLAKCRQNRESSRITVGSDDRRTSREDRELAASDVSIVKKRLGRPKGSKNKPKAPVRNVPISEYLDGTIDTTKTTSVPTTDRKPAVVQAVVQDHKVRITLEASDSDALYLKIKDEAEKHGISLGKQALNMLQGYFYQRLEITELKLELKANT